MVLPKGPFWEHVEETTNGPRMCKFCMHPFSKQTPITRFKFHWSGVQKRGTIICDKVPEAVREAALAAVDVRPPEKRLRTTSSSSNNWEPNATSTPSQEQNNQVENAVTNEATSLPSQLYSQRQLELCLEGNSIFHKFVNPEASGSCAPEPAPGTEQVGQESQRNTCDNLPLFMENTTARLITHVERDGYPERLSVNQDEPRGDSSQPTNSTRLILGRHYDQPCSSSVNKDVIMNDVENMMREAGQPIVRDGSLEGLQRNVDESRGDAFPTNKLVGGEFEENKNCIWSWLMNDATASCIGIYGMGGVGKTTLLTHIYNQLLKKPRTFPQVYWITVSQDFSISKLQILIAKEFGLNLSNEANEKKRAAKLSKALIENQQWVLILDDLWNYFDFKEVGIPIQVTGSENYVDFDEVVIPNYVTGCKLILTTRLFGVCQQMFCQRMMKVHPLSTEEAWTLFVEKLGRDTALPPKVEQIAKSVTRECAGLPLGIITMAAIMRGVDDIREWRNVLEELQESKVRQDDMEPEVFRILRFSYTHLKDSTVQQCFLYCSLFPEDFEVNRNNLIGYLIDEGVIKGMKSRQAEFDRGHAMLNKLLNVCLLERGRNYNNVRMHDLIRDMALQIQQEKSLVMVKVGVGLKELPDSEEWTENLVRVSIMKNQIREIFPSHSPRCHNLSTLLLCGNQLEFIADSFFKQLHGLKVLDLSDTYIKELPDSVSDLVSLSALLLKYCHDLRYVPSLKKLRALKRLDLSDTIALAKIPQGMEYLSNLRYLRLNGCGEMEFPGGILPKLTRLQVLIIEELIDGKYALVTVKGKEVACLRKLETLICHFEGHSDFVEYLKSLDETQSLSCFQIFVGKFDEGNHGRMLGQFRRDKSVGMVNFSINRDGDFQVMFPYAIEELVICKCEGAGSLCDVSSLKNATELESIVIEDCNSMESLVSSSWFCSAPLQSPSYNGMFSSLKELECYRCRSMKKLFPPVLLPNLVNLEVIEVKCCEKMEEIIARRDEEPVMGEEFSLSKLRILRLQGLPKLRSICSAKLICDSLEDIAVTNCPNLKRMPICLPLLGNGQPSLRRIYVEPKEWWESVEEWEHPNAKDVLRPFVWVLDPTLRVSGGKFGILRPIF